MNNIPAYVFGELTKEQAAELLKVDGSFPSGRYLIRKRGSDGKELVLSVNFRNRATHHLIQEKFGVLAVNKQSFGNHVTSVNALIEELSGETLPPKWPVRLTDRVSNPDAAEEQEADDTIGASSDEEEEEEEPAKATAPPPPVVEQDQPPQAAPQEALQPASSSSSTNTWFHNKEMSKADTDVLFKKHGLSEGKFFLRPRKVGESKEYILAVVYKGRVTQHLVKQSHPGVPFTINGTAVGSKDLAGVVEFLRSAHKFWPVPLTDHIPAEEGGAVVVPPTETIQDNNNNADAEAAQQQQQREAARKREEERLRQQQREEAEAKRKQQEEEAAAEKARRKEQEEKEAQRRREEEEKEEEERRKKETEEEEERQRLADEEAERKEREQAKERDNALALERQATLQQIQPARANSELQRAAKHQAYTQQGLEDSSPRKQHIDSLRQKHMDNGTLHNVLVERQSPGDPFGFGLASMWRIDGTVKVISWVDPEGPARDQLQAEDVLVAIDGRHADDLTIEEVKDIIRNLGNEFTAQILRPKVKVADQRKQEEHDRQVMRAQSKRIPKPRLKNGECCGAIWCHHQEHVQRAVREEEEMLKLVMQVNKRATSANQVRIGRVGVASGYSYT